MMVGLGQAHRLPRWNPPPGEPSRRVPLAELITRLVPTNGHGQRSMRTSLTTCSTSRIHFYERDRTVFSMSAKARFDV